MGVAAWGTAGPQVVWSWTGFPNPKSPFTLGGCVIDQGIVGCTPTNVPLWKITIEALYSVGIYG